MKVTLASCTHEAHLMSSTEFVFGRTPPIENVISRLCESSTIKIYVYYVLRQLGRGRDGTHGRDMESFIY
jgi:hypothetical protein